MSKKSHLFAATVFFIMLFLCIMILLYALNNAVPLMYVNALGGTADLSEFDLTTSVAHIKDAEFYAGKLLTTEEMDNNISYSYDYDKTAEYNTARIRLHVPDGDYTIFGLSPQYASVIYVNGETAGIFGYIDRDNPENNIYRIVQFSIPAKPIDGIIELVFQNAGIIHDETSYNGFYISLYETAKSRQMYDMAYHLIPVTILFTCMVLFIGFYIFLPKVRANLWFALITFFTGFLLAGNGGFVTDLLPGAGIDYRFEFYAGNIALLMICILYTFFLRALYDIPKAVPVFTCIIGTLLSALLFLPVNFPSRYSILHIGFIFAVQIVCIICVLVKIKSFKTEHIISFFGQIVFMLSGVLDLIGTSTELINYYNVTPAGILSFIFAQMMALYFVNNRAVENEKRLESENHSLNYMNRMKTELLGNISHEFKTPLTVISNASQLAARHTKDDYVRDKMELAVSEVERMKVKVNQLMKLAKAEDLQTQWNFETVDIKELFTDTISACFQTLDEHNNALLVELPNDFPKVKADSEHLAAVLVNLIDNAVRFTNNGKIIVCGEWNEEFVTISVEDTGSGINPEEKELIFNRFYTNDKSTGTGLGLHICKKVIESHGGDINIESQYGQGTKVSFTLRRVENEHDIAD